MDDGRVDLISRRTLLAGFLGAAFAPAQRGLAQSGWPDIDATFLFTNDVHACRTADGLSPNCQEEGKTDENLRRHIAALNRIAEHDWPAAIGGAATNLAGAGKPIAQPAGLVVGGDMTDDGGGQVAMPSEGSQLLQFSQRYSQGTGPDRVHVPVYAGLGNHDLDQDGQPPHADWYRRELRDYIEVNHRSSVFFKPPVPVSNYHAESDCYSWDWGGLHLVQTHRFAGDTLKGAVSGLPWLKEDLANYAGDGRPVILFQHYGWDAFSIERWDPARHTFDDEGTGAPHWWSQDDRTAMLAAVKDHNVIGIFHGHQHETAMIYERDGIDLFKPKAAFMGGFAVVHVTNDFMDVAFAEARGTAGDLIFTNAFSRRLAQR